MQQQEEGGADLQQVRGKDEEEELVFATWDCGSPLYDSFELASLHHVLERHLMVFPGAAASWSRRFEHRGSTAPPDATDRTAARRRRKVGRRRRRGWKWKGSKAAAAVFRVVTCWRNM